MRVFLKRLSTNIEVVIERKKIKNIKLRVLPGGRVRMSVPYGVAKSWVDEYLQRKLSWIEKALAYYQERSDHEADTIVQNGASARILGRPMTIIVKPSKVYKIEQKEDVIYIQSPVSDDQLAMQRQYQRWLHRESKKYFCEVINRWYPVVAPYDVEKPRLQVKKMKTRWGSCSPAHNKINLNSTLYKKTPDCIDYVVLHELSHLIYPYHNKEFYEFLTLHMPNWHEYKKVLNSVIIRV